MNQSIPKAALAVIVAGLTLATTNPRALVPATGGLWEVSGSVTGQNARPVCIAAPVELAQWEHRGRRCTNTLVTETGDKATIEYQCAGGGFGRSEVTLLTPRTLRIATQGISGDGPFNYTLHARRVGNCARR